MDRDVLGVVQGGEGIHATHRALGEFQVWAEEHHSVTDLSLAYMYGPETNAMMEATMAKISTGEMSFFEALTSVKNSLFGKTGSGFRQQIRTERIQRIYLMEQEKNGEDVVEHSMEYLRDNWGYKTLEDVRHMSGFEEPFSDEEGEEEPNNVVVENEEEEGDEEEDGRDEGEEDGDEWEDEDEEEFEGDEADG